MDLSIKSLGAAAGQEISKPLQYAIDTVGKAGGGRVFIPAGHWKLDSAQNVRVVWDGVTIEGEGESTVVEVVNWQPFLPQADASTHATILVGSATRDVVGTSLRRMRFVSSWDVQHHAPFGPQGDPKSLLLLGHPLGGFYSRRTLVEDVTTEKCGSYLVVVLGNHDGLEIRRCHVFNQYFSGIACAGATFLQVPRVIDCSASKLKGLGVQWTGPVDCQNFRGADCQQGGVMLMNADDATMWSTVEGGRLERCGNYPSETIAGCSLLVGGEVYGGRRVRVRNVTIVDSYGSAIGWGGGQLKEMVVDDCLIYGVGLGCGTDAPNRAGFGKESGIQPTAGISIAGYRLLVRRNAIFAEHTGFTAGKVACRFGLWLGATDKTGSNFIPEMDGWKDCASGNSIGGSYGEGRVFAPKNASDLGT